MNNFTLQAQSSIRSVEFIIEYLETSLHEHANGANILPIETQDEYKNDLLILKSII